MENKDAKKIVVCDCFFGHVFVFNFYNEIKVIKPVFLNEKDAILLFDNESKLRNFRE